jgi:predicted nucleic acid-binding protein
MLVDSWAWIEVFEDSDTGRKAADMMEGKGLHVSILTLAELANWCVKGGKSPSPYLHAIRKNCAILPLNEEEAELAGSSLKGLRQKAPGIGIVDALIYTQAVSKGMQVLTGDPHFKSLPEVVFLGA